MCVTLSNYTFQIEVGVSKDRMNSLTKRAILLRSSRTNFMKSMHFSTDANDLAVLKSEYDKASGESS